MDWNKAIEEKGHNRAFIIAYNYAIGTLTGFGSLKYTTRDRYPAEMELILAIKAGMIEEVEVPIDAIFVSIFSITSISIKDFKDFVMDPENLDI